MTQLQQLHPMYTKDVLMPKFVTQFQCIGSECSLSCCMYFSIFVDKKTYDHLEYDFGLSLEQKKYYKKCSASQCSESSNYAEFVMQGEHQICGFLQENLCFLHQNFGEAALPNVCYAYPRLFQVLGQQHAGLNLYLSCPRVSELALLQEDAFDFVVQSMSFRKNIVVENKFSFSGDYQLFLDIRFFCIQLIRTKNIDLWKRVALLGLFLSQLAEILANTTTVSMCSIEETGQQIHQLITATTTLIESGEVNQIYEVVKANPQYLISCVSCFVTIRRVWGMRPYFVHFFQDIDSCLSAGEDNDAYNLQFIVNNYRQGIRHLKNSLKDHPYFFEHMLLTDLLFLNFPFANQAAFSTFQRFSFVYIFMRFILAMFCAQGEKTPKELSLVVAKMMRTFQHRNMRYLMDTIDYQSLGWEGNLSAIYAHLKDEI